MSQVKRIFAARILRAMLAAIWFVVIAQCALAVQTTAISDTVYLANGATASGTLLISWPAFTTAAGEPVPGGSTTVTVPSNGAVNVALAPNAGATPAGAYYTVVMHLNGGPVTTEYWVVPATGPASLSAIRSKLMPVTRAVPIGGLSSVAGLVQKTGDTMQGPLALSADPVLPEQASTKRYVDGTAAGQAAQISSASATATAAQTTASQANATAAAAQSTANQALPKDGSQPMAGKLRLSNGQLAGRTDLIDVLSDTAATGAGNSATCTWSPVNYAGCRDDGATLNTLLANGGAGVNHTVALAPTSTVLTGRCDYYSTVSLHIGGGVTLKGNGKTFFSQTVNICFPAGVIGIIGSSSAHIEGISVRGGAPFDPANLATYVLPTGYGGAGPAADGIVLGGQSSAEDVNVSGFDRHCVTVDSTQTGGSDATRIQDAFLSGCRGDGLNYNGADSQVGIGSNVFSRSNQLYGIRANQPNAGYGNLFLAGNTSGDHNAPGLLSTGTINGTISGIVCASGTCTITMTAATTLYANVFHSTDVSASDLITLAGTTDATLNSNSYRLTAVGGGGTTFSFKYGTTETLGAGGTATYNTGQRIWALANQRGGGWAAPGGTHVFINPYSESTDGGGSFFRTDGGASFVINPQGDAVNYGGIQFRGESSSLYLPELVHIDDPINTPNLHTYFGGYNADSNGPFAWVARNTDTAGNVLSTMGMRRTSYGNTNGWWAWQASNNGADNPGNPTLNMGFTPLALSDKLTDTGRTGTVLQGASGQGSAYAPHLCIGNVATGFPDVCIITGTAAPTTGTWLNGDMVINRSPASNGILLWRCVGAGSPGTWQAVAGMTGVSASPADTTGYAQVSTSSLSSTTALDAGISVYYQGGYNAGMDFGANNTGIGANTYLLRNFAASNTNYATCFYTAGTAPTAQASFNNCPFVVSPAQVAAVKPLLIGASGTQITQSTVYSPNITPAAVAAQSCADQTFTVSGLVTTDTLSRMIPPGALGNVEIGNAYTSAANTLSIHFCNVSVAGVTPPAGVYTFRATH